MPSSIDFDCLDSTNSEAWRQIDRGLVHHGWAIQAKQQTAGRGQRGHTWVSDWGGLYLSVVLEPNVAVSRAEEFTLWSAWAIAKAINLYLPQPLVKLKWRNDLLIYDQKLGGILVETRCQGTQIKYAVIGVGINYENAVPEGAIALQQVVPHQISSLSQLSQIAHQAILQGYDYWRNAGMTEVLASYSVSAKMGGQEQKKWRSP